MWMFFLQVALGSAGNILIPLLIYSEPNANISRDRWKLIFGFAWGGLDFDMEMFYLYFLVLPRQKTPPRSIFIDFKYTGKCIALFEVGKNWLFSQLFWFPLRFFYAPKTTRLFFLSRFQNFCPQKYFDILFGLFCNNVLEFRGSSFSWSIKGGKLLFIASIQGLQKILANSGRQKTFETPRKSYQNSGPPQFSLGEHLGRYHEILEFAGFGWNFRNFPDFHGKTRIIICSWQFQLKTVI